MIVGNILADFLQYYRENKGVELFSFVFMLNQIHLIIMFEDTIGFVKIFKTAISFFKSLLNCLYINTCG